MDMIFDNLLLSYLILDVSLLVLIQYNIFCLVPLLCKSISFIEHSHCFWQWLCQISNERFAIHIGWWQIFISMFKMFCFFQCPLLLILLFVFRIIKAYLDWIISMRLPILFINFSILLLRLLFYLLLMVLFIDIAQDVELLFVISQQLFLPFNWEFYLSIIKVKFWHFLITNNIVGISYWSKMSYCLLLYVWFI